MKDKLLGCEIVVDNSLPNNCFIMLGTENFVMNNNGVLTEGVLLGDYIVIKPENKQ